MIQSNERGSVIDSQQTLYEEINKEIERCKDWTYWYITYWRVVIIDGKQIKPERISIGGTSWYLLQQEKLRKELIEKNVENILRGSPTCLTMQQQS